MLELPLSGKILKCLGHELWSLVRPYNIWCSISAEYCKKGNGEAGGSCVLAHVNDLWPVSVTVSNN